MKNAINLVFMDCESSETFAFPRASFSRRGMRTSLQDRHASILAVAPNVGKSRVQLEIAWPTRVALAAPTSRRTTSFFCLLLVSCQFLR